MLEANTVFSRKETIELNRFQLFVKGRVYLILFMLWFIFLGTLLLILGVGTAAKIIGAVFVVVFGLGFPGFCWFAILLLIRIQLHSSKLISDETNNYYKIDENSLFNRLTRPGCESTFEAQWNLVYRAYETKTHFFIYLNNVQAFVIAKEGIFGGTAEDLAEMLSKALGKDFIRTLSAKKQSAIKAVNAESPVSPVGTENPESPENAKGSENKPEESRA